MKGDTHKDRTTPTVLSCKFFSAATSGVVCLVLALLSALTDPVTMIAKFRVRLTPGSPLHDILLQEMDSVRIQVYLFNVTNTDRFATGLDYKLKVEEVGPFTYREKRRNLNLELNSDTQEMRFTPNLSLIYSPEESVGDPRQFNMSVPNLALLGMTSMLASYSYFVRTGFNMLINRVEAKPFTTLSVHDYLWGHEDPLISLANTYLPHWIYFDKLGILDRIYEKKKNLELLVGTENDNRFRIKTMDGVHGLNIWNYENLGNRTRCNTFTDVYEGMGYPMGLTTEVPIRIYRTALCRFLELQFVGRETMSYGSDAQVYQLKNTSFSLNQDTTCMCRYGICIDGMSDISPCYYGLPLTVSLPHFEGVAPALTSRLEGLRPNPSKYRSRFVVEPVLGLSLESDFWVQVNMVVADVSYNSVAAPFASMVLPVGNLRVTQPALPEDTVRQLSLMFQTAPKIVLASNILLTLAGLALLTYSVCLVFSTSHNIGGKRIIYSMPHNITQKSKTLSIGKESDSEFEKLNQDL